MRARSLVLKQSFDSRLCIARITRRTCLAIDRGVGVARCFDRLRRQGIRRPVGLLPDVAPAEDGAWYTASTWGRWATSIHRRARSARSRSVPVPRHTRDRRAGWCGLDHRRRSERDRPRRPRQRRGQGLPAAGRSAQHEPEHGGLRWRRTLWFTGQSGIYGRLDPQTGEIEVFDDADGRGPYGITGTPVGDVWYASLAGSHIAKIDRASGAAQIVEPPTADQGARRVWSDSKGRIWVAEWNAGQVGLHDPGTGDWREWKLPGANPQAYAVYVDERDIVWLTDFGANAIVRFDPSTEAFDPIELEPGCRGAATPRSTRPARGAESAVDKLVLVTER